MRAILSCNITGVLLAGGLSRRMGGGDKGLLLLAGRPLVARALERLSPQVSTVVISANRNIEQYAAFGKIAADEIGAFCGPLAGMHAGMRAAKNEWILSAPCDSPFLPHNLAQKLAAAAQKNRADIAVAGANNREQPTFLLARVSLARDLEKFLSDGGRKIDSWYGQCNYAVAEFADAEAFANINTPEELSAAAAKYRSADAD